MTLSIIILNYKTKGLLKQCLRGIVEAQLPISHEVIVVDNDSGDGSLDMVRELFPQVIRIASPTNVGFAAGMNLGFTRATGQYVMTLNTDVAIFGPAVHALIDYLNASPRVGIVAPRLINPDGTVQWSCCRFPSRWVPILRRTPLGTLPWARQHIRDFLMSDWDHRDNRAVDWVLGGCMVVRRSALDAVGMFDEHFFLYIEDVDLCRRMWQAGWAVHYLGTAEMVHYHRRESAEHPGLRGLLSYPTRVHVRSWLYYEKKYFRRPIPKSTA